MSYNTYTLLTSRLERIMWRAGKLTCTKKHRGDLSMRETLKTLIENSENIYNTLDLPILFEEFEWLRKRQIIFPETSTLLNGLIKTSSKIKDSSKIFNNESDCFMLAIPDAFKINKLRISGLLVNICNWSEREQLIRDFFTWLELPVPESKNRGDVVSINITYQMFNDNKEMYYRACIPLSLLNDLLNAQDGDEYWKIIGKYENQNAFDLTTDQSAYQQKLVKLILALLLYKKTVQNSLIPGYPATKKTKLDSNIITKYSSSTLSTPHYYHESPSEHYRSWTFRQLFADRFYQHEYKDWPRGSRIVFVKESYVNLKEIDPQTLVKK